MKKLLVVLMALGMSLGVAPARGDAPRWVLDGYPDARNRTAYVKVTRGGEFVGYVQVRLVEVRGTLKFTRDNLRIAVLDSQGRPLG